MELRNKHAQQDAAPRAGISERTARRIDRGESKGTRPPRRWRTRTDPLEDVWNRSSDRFSRRRQHSSRSHSSKPLKNTTRKSTGAPTAARWSAGRAAGARSMARTRP